MADGLTYGTLVQGDPTCSRCGSDDVLIRTPDGVLTDTITVDAHGAIVCRNCITDPEELAQARQIIEGLEDDAEKIRKRWLGEDFHTLNERQRKRRAKRRGPAPEELEKLLDQLNEIEEIAANIEYIIDSNRQLAHHALTGE